MKFNFDQLVKINKDNIEKLRNENYECKEKKIQLAIEKILKNNNCFFEMKMDTAIDILSNLIEKESIMETYLYLVSSENLKN